jgi:hypothetical protein
MANQAQGVELPYLGQQIAYIRDDPNLAYV